MLNPARPGRRPRARQAGVSLTEIMIGLTVGLIVTAGTLGLLGGHLRSSADLLSASRLNAEVRAAMDLVVRDLRRATYWGNAQASTWINSSLPLVANPFVAVAVGDGQVTYRYDANRNGELDDGEVFRLAHDADDGVVTLETLTADGSSISTLVVTDPLVTEVTAVDFDLVDRTATTTCLQAGPGPVAPTPPLIHVREISVTLTARLRAAPAVVRTATEAVRIRNDWVEGSCPG